VNTSDILDILLTTIPKGGKDRFHYRPNTEQNNGSEEIGTIESEEEIEEEDVSKCSVDREIY
jgi:hypothetical protein